MCAGAVAVTWSLNLSAVYPVMKILGSGANLQTWVKAEIDSLEKQLNEKPYDELLANLDKEIAGLRALPETLDRDVRLRKLSSERYKLHDEQGKINSRLYWYQVLQTKVIVRLPTDRFETFCVIVVAVIVCVALKGIFEFLQESLVGVVVCRTLFDLRNRFFRSTVHQDTRQIAAAGNAELITRFTNDVEHIGIGQLDYLSNPFTDLGCRLWLPSTQLSVKHFSECVHSARSWSP
jgi:ATP-binding cassette subfamily B protein/subfamily B ATP-binding cassette protein MsbA